MGGILKQFGLGLLGVNRVTNPVKLKDGELRTAQNAAVSQNRGRAALLKRPGLGCLLDTTTASVLAVAPLPFDDPSPGTPIVPGYPPLMPYPRSWPSGVTTTSEPTTNSVPIAWPEVEGADGYRLLIPSIGVNNDLGDVLATTVSGLDPDTAYDIIIKPYNDRGDGAGTTVSITTDPIPIPESGWFTVPIASITGDGIGLDGIWLSTAGAWDDAAGLAAGDTRSCVCVPSTNSISLDGGAFVNPAGLPSGFTVVNMSTVFIAGGSGYAPEPFNGAGPAKIRVVIDGSLRGDSSPSAKFNTDPPSSLAYTWPGAVPPTLAEIQAAVIDVTLFGGLTNNLYLGSNGAANVCRIVGEYEIH